MSLLRIPLKGHFYDLGPQSPFIERLHLGYTQFKKLTFITLLLE